MTGLVDDRPLRIIWNIHQSSPLAYSITFPHADCFYAPSRSLTPSVSCQIFLDRQLALDRVDPPFSMSEPARENRDARQTGPIRRRIATGGTCIWFNCQQVILRQGTPNFVVDGRRCDHRKGYHRRWADPYGLHLLRTPLGTFRSASARSRCGDTEVIFGFPLTWKRVGRLPRAFTALPTTFVKHRGDGSTRVRRVFHTTLFRTCYIFN